ncbi:MAG: 30S ribosomal protein S4 [Candidatus Omnitrophica bacterium]|nr:30S ribosomal protein S4 [Candidatus Omnitrophota bacterium]
MARYTGSKCRLCRREGTKLFLKGSRCLTDKCAFTRRSYSPGEHGQGRRSRSKLSNYGMQLREKQKVKRIYGILEKQFRRYFVIASKKSGATGEVLLQLLERRIDNVIFRSCIAASRNQARQFVRHAFISINGRKVTIPSFLVKPDSKITIKPKGKLANLIKENLEANKERAVPAWMRADHEKLTLEILKLPERSDVQFPISEQLIVELYSK